MNFYGQFHRLLTTASRTLSKQTFNEIWLYRLCCMCLNVYDTYIMYNIYTYIYVFVCVCGFCFWLNFDVLSCLACINIGLHVHLGHCRAYYNSAGVLVL